MVKALDNLLVAAGAAYLGEAVIPARAPGHVRPDYWTLPVTQTAVVDIAPSINWQTLVSVVPSDPYEVVINRYVITTIPFPPPAGLTPANFAFRMRDDKGPEPFVTLDFRQNRHNDTLFPLVRQNIFVQMTDIDLFALQVRNTSAITVRVAAALFGWQYWDPDSAGEKTETIVDA